MNEDFYIGEIRLFGAPWVPLGWRFCDGSLLSCTEYETLFSLIGNRYGGDGVVNFALPDLRSRVGIGYSEHNSVGQTGGAESVILPLEGLPKHTHAAACSTGNKPGSKNAANAFWSASAEGGRRYAPAPGIFQMALDSVQTEGKGEPHENRIPFLALTYIICIFGTYPQRK